VAKSGIRFSTFPRTEPPPEFVPGLVALFQAHESKIATHDLDKGLTSDEVLAVLSEGLSEMGFEVETGKRRTQKIERPVFYGENGTPILNYQIDAYHPSWRCGLEIEAGRAWMGNAVYRDLIQASVMVGVDYLCLAVPNSYKYNSSGKAAVSKDYENTRDVADAVYGHSRVKLPYKLTVIGY
jgi:hypothetical protein